MDANYGEAVFITTKRMNEQFLACVLACDQEAYYRTSSFSISLWT